MRAYHQPSKNPDQTIYQVPALPTKETYVLAVLENWAALPGLETVDTYSWRPPARAVLADLALSVGPFLHLKRKKFINISVRFECYTQRVVRFLCYLLNPLEKCERRALSNCSSNLLFRFCDCLALRQEFAENLVLVLPFPAPISFKNLLVLLLLPRPT